MPKPKDAPSADPFVSLSWGDLEEWVGSRSLERGRGYQMKRRVLLLACSAEGRLSGRVAGTAIYTTHVSRCAAGSRALTSTCSCPLGGDCKHAVAVVLEYLERLKAGKEIPGELPPLPGDNAGDDGNAVDEWEPEGMDEEDEDDVVASERPRKRRGRSRQAGRADVATYLQGLTEAELIGLVTELAGMSEEARRAVETRAQLAGGKAAEIVRAARHELRRVTSEQGWRNSWTGEGHTPDYGPLTKYLNKLLGAGQADRVLVLGQELLQLGNRQVEQCDDEGDTGIAISEALGPVWEALSQSSLGPAERILWIYDRLSEDEFGLCAGCAEADVWDVDAGVRGQVADVLVERLASQDAGDPAEDEWGSRYRRARLAGWTVEALRNAGRADEAVALAVREAKITDDCERAVDLLLETGQADEARALAVEGIHRTQAKYPGISAQLRSRLRRLAAESGDHAPAAALTAEEFALRPSLEGYRSLREAARRAGVWDQARGCVLESLRGGPAASLHPDWPLPPTETAPEGGDRPPERHYSLLTEIALDEGDHAAALKWDGHYADRPYGWGGGGLAEQVAHGVAGTHPDEAVAIWKRLAEAAISRGNRSAYEDSLRHLRPMQRLLADLGREDEWTEYLSELRAEHRRKRALLETLDRLSDRPIVGQPEAGPAP